MTSLSKTQVKGFGVWCDWITIATYKFKAYTDMAAYLRKQLSTEKWKAARWLQYDGFNYDHFAFYGHATQSHGKEHYIVKISGNMAGQMLTDIARQPFSEGFYCTRMDLQRTRQPPDWWKPRELYDWLVSEGRTCSIIQSNTSTVYIGSRQSGRFTRLYEKEYESKYLRLEIELKGQHSRIGWDYVRAGNSVDDLYGSHLAKLPLFKTAVQDFTPDEFNDLDLTLHEQIVESEKQFEWLMTLANKFQQMTKDHTIGDRVKALFYALSMENSENDNTD